jgi:restriction system protein
MSGLSLIRNPPAGKIFVRNMFPTDAHKSEWLQTAHRRSESEVKLLLRHFLVSTGSNRKDALDVQFLLSRIRDGASADDIQEHDRRLLLHHRSEGRYPVWEGLGWVIDLLPHHPRMALSVIDAFFYAYYYQLTDNYVGRLI